MPDVRLSPRQAECLRLVYQRRTTKEIAVILGLAPGTVSTYCSEAVALLGARDRRHAAEILHALETAPSNQGPQSEGVADEAVIPPTIVPPGKPAHPLGPLSPQNRDADNDTGVFARLAWILVLAIGLAVGFGSIVSSTRAISDVVRERQ
ncbi:helix-turn-helix domain-containing protein [Sphingomonas sp. XXL09]|uniref:helix-turn-helix domain-containing protein n=1 Tax=Sphingomonas sp. XXL09 TaxID=3457787 RepID=UPI00406BB734